MPLGISDRNRTNFLDKKPTTYILFWWEKSWKQFLQLLLGLSWYDPGTLAYQLSVIIVSTFLNGNLESITKVFQRIAMKHLQTFSRIQKHLLTSDNNTVTNLDTNWNISKSQKTQKTLLGRWKRQERFRHMQQLWYLPMQKQKQELFWAVPLVSMNSIMFSFFLTVHFFALKIKSVWLTFSFVLQTHGFTLVFCLLVNVKRKY